MDPISLYNPSYTLDYETMILSPIPNYFSDLLAKQAELAKTGESQLTQQEIEELSEKHDTKQISNKDLINYLADKGVIDRPKTFEFDAGERVVWTGPQAWLESGRTRSGRSSGTPGVAHFLNPLMEEMHKKLSAELSAFELLRKTGGVG